MAKKKLLSNIWPKIYDIDSAKKAMKQGIYACGLIAIVTFGFIVASLFGHEFLDIDIYAIIDVLLAIFIGIGIYKKSRMVSIMGLSYYILQKIIMWSQHGGPKNVVIAVLITLMFITSIRGSSFYHKLRKSNILKKKVIVLNLLSLLYSIIIFVAVSFILSYFFPDKIASLVNGEVIYNKNWIVIPRILAIIFYFLSLMGLMPFTKNKNIVNYSLSEKEAKEYKLYKVSYDNEKGRIID